MQVCMYVYACSTSMFFACVCMCLCSYVCVCDCGCSCVSMCGCIYKDLALISGIRNEVITSTLPHLAAILVRAECMDG
jgi:hypothetical protein